MVLVSHPITSLGRFFIRPSQQALGENMPTALCLYCDYTNADYLDVIDHEAAEHPLEIMEVG